MQRLARLIGAFVQATRPRGVRVRDAYLNAIDGTRLQRLLAENVKPLPTYGRTAPSPPGRRGSPCAARSARCSRRPTASTTGSPRAGRRWRATSRSRALLEAEGLPVADPAPTAPGCERHGLTWALLRPDRFVFACGGPDDVRAGARAWRRIAPPARIEVAA